MTTAEDLVRAKKEFNQYSKDVLPLIKNLKAKALTGVTLNQAETDALARYARITQLIQSGKTKGLFS